MTDPVRLMDDPTETPALRRALRHEAQHGAPAKLQAAVWAALAVQMAGAGQAAAATASSMAAAAKGIAGGGLVSLSLAKSFAIGLGVGVVVATGGPMLLPEDGNAKRTAAAPLPSQPSVVPEARVEAAPERKPPRTTASALPPMPPTRVDDPRARVPPGEARTAPELDRDPAQSTPARESFPSLARLEALRVAEARSALRHGAGALCLQKLDELDAQVPSGVLAQERQALRIEALALVGGVGAAREAADAFLKRYPESPHARRVRAWATPSE